MGADVTHSGGRGELGIGDVEEVGAPEQGDQLVPGRHMGGIVVGVAVRKAVGDRRGPVGGDGRGPDQLLQVRPVVLGVAGRDHRGRFPAPRVPVGVAVETLDTDRGGIVVQLAGVDAELGHDAQDELGEQARPVGVEERSQGPTDPVVIDPGELPRRHPEQARIERGRPLTQGIKRLPAQ